jgi:hypothetical protein
LSVWFWPAFWRSRPPRRSPEAVAMAEAVAALAVAVAMAVVVVAILGVAVAISVVLAAISSVVEAMSLVVEAISLGLPGITLQGAVLPAVVSHNAEETTLVGAEIISGTTEIISGMIETISGTTEISSLESHSGMITGMIIRTAIIVTIPATILTDNIHQQT